MKSKIIKSSVSSGIDFVCVEITNGVTKCLVACVYCPPLLFSPDAVSELEETLAELAHTYDNLIVCGDFNVNILSTNNKTNEFFSFVQGVYLSAVNTSEPTYFNTSNPSLLDLFLISNNNKALFYNQISPPSILDHDMIFLSYDFEVATANLSTLHVFRDYSRIDVELLLCRCFSLPWHEIENIPNIDTKLDIFYSLIRSVYDEFVPIRSRFVNKKDVPWYCNEIKNLIAERELLYRRHRRLRTNESLSEYKRIRNLVTTKVRDAKKAYFFRKLDSNLSPKELWRNLKTIGIHSGIKAECELEPDELNHHFCSTYTSRHNFPRRQRPIVSDGFSFRCVEPSEVLYAINSIKSSATGSDNIPPKFIKLILPCILPVLTRIYNSCITASYFPMAWKHAVITPIAKTAMPNSPSDFRPISILCFLAKALEKLLSYQLLEYLESNAFLTPYQSGYRRNHSCESVLLKVSTDIRIALDNDEICYLSLLDFSKAFDSLNHCNLLHKLATLFHFGSTTINLIESFLSNRTQQVKAGSGFSQSLPILSGVPQGSILGPLLFILYINDLPSVVCNSSVHIFADDVQVYINRPIGLLEDCAARLNDDLERIQQWSIKNNLSLNVSKCKYIIFRRKRLDSVDFPPIFLNGTPLSRVERTKNLGIWINSDMSCCDHVAAILGKVYGNLRRLWLHAAFLPRATKARLIKALIVPHITYGMNVYTKLDYRCQRKLEVAFNDCTRFIFNLRRFDHISSFRDSILGCNLFVYLQYRALCYFHKLLYVQEPNYLSSFITRLRSTRRFDMLVPRSFSLIGQRSYFAQVTGMWNALPDDIQCLHSIVAFKKRIFQHLLQY